MVFFREKTGGEDTRHENENRVLKTEVIKLTNLLQQAEQEKKRRHQEIIEKKASTD